MAGTSRPAPKDRTVTLNQPPGDNGGGGKGGGGKGGGPNRPISPSKAAAARAAAIRKQRNRKVVIGAGVVVAAIAVLAVVLSTTGGSSGKKAAVVPAAATGPGGSFTIGTGPVLVEQYGDFQCPHCDEWFKTVEPSVITLANQGRVTFAFHNFPFLGSESFTEANAAAAAGDVGKFWEMHNFLYAHQPSTENSGFWTNDQLIAALQTVGADTPQTEAAVKSHKYNAWLSQQAAAASKRGVTATPTVFVNNQQLSDNSTPTPLLAAVANATAAKK